MFSEMRSNKSFCICLQINQEPRSQAEYFQLFYIRCMEKFFLQNIRIDFKMLVGNFPKTFPRGDFPSDNFPSGNFPNVQFPNRQLPKG